jgi:hypothetical protein
MFFPRDPSTGRVKKLAIDIEVMGVLPAGEAEPIMQWLAALPYPWCSNIQALENIPAIDGLRPIEGFLGGRGRTKSVNV